ncbi:MAG: T9SS type A sorting domain-containing protein, partial [Ignavibacteriales bacterium]|nr:T9SS type A sorting domain-containing protein [Ignavibacteriales bacterium]
QKGILLKIFASPTFGIAGVDPYGGTNLGANISNSSIIGNISTNDDRIVTVSSDGEVFSLTSFFLNTSGFPKQTYDSIYTSPILADLNNDGQRDIIVLSGTKFFAFNASGSLLDYFPVQTTSTTRFLAQPLAADVDGNGSMDIVAVSQEGLVFAYDNRGKLLNGFPLLSGKNNGATPAISLYADTIALVVASDDGNVYAWKTGTVNPTTWKSEWTQYQHDAQGSGLIDSPLSGQPISNSFFPKERAYNYPNPVYGNDPLYGNNTIIRYYLKDDATVKIRIFDLAGDMLKEMNGTGNGGFDNEVKWDVSEIQSGVYFAHIEAKGAKATAETIIKIAVVK